jgi:O-antigen/teichoic acid export membrane protein
MGPIPRNIIANIAGQGWSAAMMLLLVPLYVRLLGVEAYGLIGVYATLQAALQILDLGLSQTINRQLARYRALPDEGAEARDFVRTLELGYWALGLLIGISVAAAAPVLARHWLKLGTMPVETAERAMLIMGAVAALQWPLSLYEGGLLGLQRQVLLNGLRIGVSTAGAVGTALVLWLVSPTISAYFTWQIVVAAINVACLALALWRSLPAAAGAPRFRPALLAQHWRFAAGVGGISISGILLSQLDKIVLSKLLPLEAFGYYTLAGVVSSVIPLLVAGPVFNGVFPQLTTFVAAGSEREVSELYHRGTQLMAVFVATVGGVIACFSSDILLVWTRSAAAAETAGPIASILVLGMALNALMSLPYALQLSHGWTGLGLRINAALLVLLVPTILALTARFGAVGAAGTWVVLNGVYMGVGVPLTHRRLLRGEMAAWFVHDIVPPVAAALLVVGAGRLLVPAGGGVVTVVAMSVVMVAALAASALVAPLVRRAALGIVARTRAPEGR